MSKFNELLKLQRARDKEECEDRKKINAHHSDTNRALQWFIDNWKHR